MGCKATNSKYLQLVAGSLEIEIDACARPSVVVEPHMVEY